MGWADEQHLATAGFDTTVKVWKIEGRNLKLCWERRLGESNLQGSIVGFGFLPEKSWLLGVGWRNEILVWDLATGEPRHVFPPAESPWNSLVLSPQRRYLAAGGAKNSQVDVWDVSIDKPQLRHRLVLFPVARQTEVEWRRPPDAAAAQQIATLTGIRVSMRPQVVGLAFSPDEAWLAATLGDGTVWLIDAHTGQIASRGFGHPADRLGMYWVRPLFNRRGELLTVAHDGALRRWDFGPWHAGRRLLDGNGRALLRGGQFRRAANGRLWLRTERCCGMGSGHKSTAAGSGNRQPPLPSAGLPSHSRTSGTDYRHRPR